MIFTQKQTVLLMQTTWLGWGGLTLRPTSQEEIPVSACVVARNSTLVFPLALLLHMSMVLDPTPRSTNTACDTTLVESGFSSTFCWAQGSVGLWGYPELVSQEAGFEENVAVLAAHPRELKWGRTEKLNPVQVVFMMRSLFWKRAQSTWGRTSCCPSKGQKWEPLLIQGSPGWLLGETPSSHMSLCSEVSTSRLRCRGLLTPG